MKAITSQEHSQEHPEMLPTPRTQFSTQIVGLILSNATSRSREVTAAGTGSSQHASYLSSPGGVDEASVREASTLKIEDINSVFNHLTGGFQLPADRGELVPVGCQRRLSSPAADIEDAIIREANASPAIRRMSEADRTLATLGTDPA